ncbi:hypothetical protein H8A95_30890 [Bradyrhizobium sp. Pear76]|uniref:hypothetical protein n=1 Tax=Bradyrhizobium oropedii TaxID=1571201 RepID=UPI001E4FAA38|nr:hypothetical protein [Bradyrhizobium oropedii]MCC8966619.1 hypothetical protein [Bradyrhizobium oropedii]
MKLPLSDHERETAVENLSEIIDDVRPIFIVTTSEGSLDLEGVLSAIETKKVAIIPIGYDDEIGKSRELHHLFPSLPTIEDEIYLRMSDVEFDQFTICPGWGSLSGTVDDEGFLVVAGEPKPFSNSLYTILTTLSERGTEFKLRVMDGCVIGTYSGLDSPRHNLNNGDELRCAVVRIEL